MVREGILPTILACSNAYILDHDLGDSSQGYVAPINAAKTILQYYNSGNVRQSTVLDAGCGTGLSGIAVREALGREAVIHGIDISTGMLDTAVKTGVYRSLKPANLSESLSISDGSYDVVVCVGTLTAGHVGPVPALREFVRVCRSGGLVVATVRENIWSERGYEAEVERLSSTGIAKLRSASSMPYREGQGVNAKMLVLEKA